MIRKKAKPPTRLLPRTKHYRQQSVQAAQRFLALKGFALSHNTVRHYGTLIGVGWVRAKKRYERVFNQEDLVRLGAVALLKRIGATDTQVIQWLANPTKELLVTRLNDIDHARHAAARMIDSLR